MIPVNPSAVPPPPTRVAQSSGGEPGSSSALPSSWNCPLWTAKAAGANANVAYCSSSDRMNSTLHDRAKARRVRELASPKAPRDNIDVTSLVARPRSMPFVPDPPIGLDPRNEIPLMSGFHRPPGGRARMVGREEYPLPGGERY